MKYNNFNYKLKIKKIEYIFIFKIEIHNETKQLLLTMHKTDAIVNIFGGYFENNF